MCIRDSINAEYMGIDIREDINEALKKKQPVVALESTIITHGMEYPINKNTALGVEHIIKEQGALPATIAIIDGRIKVGLTEEEIDSLAKSGKQTAIKCSRRDLASVCIKKQNGSTTVAATMLIANLVGIKIFVTGGIGGVHRGTETTFDISADLVELGKTPVAVVCAGAKSILDIPKTLEYLETQGVPIVGYKTEKFPEFFTSDSGFKVSTKLDDAKQCAELVDFQFQKLQLHTGILITVPIPAENEANGQLVKKAIEQALKEQNEQGIKGAESTPFLLKRIAELTDGNSSTCLLYTSPSPRDKRQSRMPSSA
eukprot:TRINITY_DN324_c0_g1_i7.p1 TRINITY_DN324_c0_g1~~TRINITY_DN324_c0_g1_i7.p1  ORF type:complete len:314 (-),score=173.10 TRINITY_DN324_c0_g1_i7:15-956(-)